MTTIVCSDCKRILGKEKFAKSQLKKKVSKARRCLSCAKIVDGCSNSNSHNNPCYHGCITKEEFDCVEHHKVLEEWDKQNEENKCCNEFINTTHIHYMRDTTFGRFVIAHITDDYLKDKNNDILLLRLLLLVEMRYLYIPKHEGKDVGSESEYTRNYSKYMRDVATKRGRIKFMAREIPCKCMEEKRIAAKSMEKVAMCYGCLEVFPKEKMLRCKGCDYVQYCSEECSKKDWPNHKEWCKENGVSSISVPSVGEPSDVDSEEEEEEMDDVDNDNKARDENNDHFLYNTNINTNK